MSGKEACVPVHPKDIQVRARATEVLSTPNLPKSFYLYTGVLLCWNKFAPYISTHKDILENHVALLWGRPTYGCPQAFGHIVYI